MAKVYEEKKVTETVQEFVKMICDLCGRESKRYGTWPSGVGYNVNDTEIKVSINQKEGSSYPDGGWGTEIEVDMCPTCFKTKLIPWLKSQGVKIQEEEWDF